MIYEGEFRQNNYHGSGTMWWYKSKEDFEKQDTQKAGYYKGSWDNNQFHGHGSYYWIDKKQTFTGRL